MTRKSKREIARAVDDLAGGEYPQATLEEVLSADVIEFAPNLDADLPVWVIDGEAKSVSRQVRADAMRVWLGSEPQYVDPETLPEGALDHSVSEEEIA